MCCNVFEAVLKRAFFSLLVYNIFIKFKERKMVDGTKSLYRDYEILLIKNDELSEENRKLKYSQTLLEKKNEILKLREQKAKDFIKYGWNKSWNSNITNTDK